MLRRYLRPASRAFGSHAISPAQQRLIDTEKRFGAHNYAPIEVVLERGQGAHVWDTDGNQYIDFLSAYSAVNQGHCHPALVEAMQTQCAKLTLTSRAFYNSELPHTLEYLTEYFNFDRALMMNTGVEAVETALKLARKWGYQVKGIPENEAKLVFCHNNFMGRTLGVISASNDQNACNSFGPFLPGMVTIPYNCTESLRAILSSDPTIAGFMFEPVQGEAGVIVPDDGYYRAVRNITQDCNVLMIADEVQTGLGRTGYTKAVDYEQIQPDIATFGKALSGGMMPVSAVLASEEVMSVLEPGQHGSTFGGNPLACVIARAALDVLRDEKMPEQSRAKGELMMSLLRDIKSPYVAEVRGRGLMLAIDIIPQGDRDAHDLCYLFREQGVLAKYTHGNTIRFAPPLVISEDDIRSACAGIANALEKFGSI
jgi:ornithine--oxo-acid transaminase